MKLLTFNTKAKYNLTIRNYIAYPAVTKVYSLYQLPPLHTAAKNGDLNKVKELVNESQADILDASPGVSMKDYSIVTADLCWN